MLNTPFIVPVTLFLAIAAIVILRGPIGRALADRIAGRPTRDPDAERRTVAELDELRRRLGEMEERLDFAERLLARRGDDARLPPPR
jgi:hypothetical protein